jgi:hypothetical protein
MGSVCEGKVVIAQFRWPNWAGTVPSSSQRIYSRKALGGRTAIFTLIIFNNLQKWMAGKIAPVCAAKRGCVRRSAAACLFRRTFAHGTATSRNAGERSVGSIAAETALFRSSLGKMNGCCSDDSLAFLNGDELVRL